MKLHFSDQRVRFVLICVGLALSLKVLEVLWGVVSTYVAAFLVFLILPVSSMLMMWKGRYVSRAFPWYPAAWLVFVVSAIPLLFVVVALLYAYNPVKLMELLMK